VSEIFREIDEELRQDKLKEQWTKYGKYMIAVAVVIVGAVGGFKGWEAYEQQQREAAAALYLEAAQLSSQNDLTGAAAKLGQVATEGNLGYRIVGLLQQAAVLSEAGDKEGAAAIYQKLAADPDVPGRYQDLAVLLMAMQQADTADPADLMERLRPISGNDKPWRYSAREVMAGLMLRMNDLAAAREELQGLADDLDAPAGARARAAELLQTLPE